MSKIVEQKALEAYPIYYFFEKREGYIKGYDQAIQDFLENAEEWLQDSLDRRYVVRNFHTGEYYSIQDMIKDFKNYMEDERNTTKTD